MIQIEVAFNPDSSGSVSMSWNVTDYTSQSIHFMLRFSHPINISQSDEPDELLILLNLQNFTTTKGAPIPSNTVLRRLIPA